MANKFTDYDMRKFAIKDQKDIYAFLDAVKKGLVQTEAIVKKLSMSNAAQASVIRGLEKHRAAAAQVNDAQVDPDAPIFASEDVTGSDSVKLNLIQKLKAAEEKDVPTEEEVPAKESTPSDEPQEAPDLVGSEPNSAVDGYVNKEGDVPAEDSEQEDQAVESEVESKDAVRYRGYEKKRFKNGQTRYFLDGILVGKADVPEDIKVELDKLLG